jgi:hypothetical protein
VGKREFMVAGVLVAFVGAASCRSPGDPGYQRDPIGWVPTPDGHWSIEQDGFSMQTRSLAGLIGTWWVDPVFQVRGNAEPVTLRRAVLRTATGSYRGTVRSPYAPAGGGFLAASWEFDEAHPMPKVLGHAPEIALELVVGKELRSAQIIYERREPYW